jgi:nucleoside-diphosphate-sugar epimerase
MQGSIMSPWLVVKMTQDQSAQSLAAQQVLGYHPRPLKDTLKRNYDWLVENGRL